MIPYQLKTQFFFFLTNLHDKESYLFEKKKKKINLKVEIYIRFPTT
jgi:hypothetical protein